MRQAIVTKYLGPTNHRGSRVKATAQAGSMVYSWDDALDADENHAKAATAYAESKEWLWKNADGTPSMRLVGGAMPDGSGYCFVLIPSTSDKGAK